MSDKNELALSKNSAQSARKPNAFMQFLIAIIANTVALQYGFQVGWITPMTKILKSDQSPAGYPISDSEMSTIASIHCITAMVGISMFAYIVDSYGRKIALITAATFQMLCWVIKLCSASTAWLIIARLCCGVATAGCYGVVPMYVREISEDRIRGILGAIFILAQNIGLLIIFAMGTYLNYYTILWIVVSLSTVTFVMMLKMPESPAYLVKRGKIEEAALTLAFLKRLDVSDNNINKEIEIMKNEELAYKSLPEISFTSILKNKSWRYGFFLVTVLMVLLTNSGNFAILTYGPTVLRSSGVTVNPDLLILCFPTVSILGSFTSMSCVEKFGRKPISIMSYMMAALSLGTLATCILFLGNNTIPAWLPVITIVIYLFSYAAGISSIAYIVMAELFNFQIRAKIFGVVVTFGWFSSFLHVLSYTPLSKLLGVYSIFYWYAVVNFIGVLVCIIFLPETKGKNVEEIEISLNKK